MKLAFGRNDAELMLVVLFWAFNVSVVKVCLREMRPLAFNALRFGCAAALLMALTWWFEGSLRIPRRDLGRVLLLGLVGHALYQLCFVLGLARTTASSTALIFGSTPVVVGILSRMAGHERVGLLEAAGALTAFYGVYLIVAASGEARRDRLAPDEQTIGDLLLLGAVLCWSAYTVLSKSLLERHSPLKVTAVSLSIGAVLMAPAAIPDLARQDWGSVSDLSWAGLAYSFVFALVVSYVIWYRSVKKVGNLKTAIYSNMVPVFGTLFGVWLLGERLTAGVGFGGACIFAGIIMTRLSAARAPASARPPEAGAA